MASFPRQALTRLKHASVADPDLVDPSTFPDFFFAGPQRTGSTWLHEVLSVHPELYLSEPKELYYWNTLQDPDHWQRTSTELEQYLRHFHDQDLIRRREAYCEDRYRRHYRPTKYGEATASYAAAVDADVIDDILALNPDLRVVITIRNPLDRIWSHAKKDLGRTETGRNLDSVSQDEFAMFFDHKYNRRCGFYSKIIDLWREKLKPNHVFVGLFDDITRRPIEYVTDVLKFLGVDTNREYFEHRIDRNPNPTEDAGEMPEPFKSELTALYADEIDLLRRNYSVPW